jgi:hypothetical protein
MTLFELIFAMVTGAIFVSSSGHLFRTRHSENTTVVLVTGLLAVLSTALLVLQGAAWVIAHRPHLSFPQFGHARPAEPGGPATNPPAGTGAPEDRSDPSVPSPQTVLVHPLGESAPANDEAQSWSTPLSFSLTSSSKVEASESASDIRFRLVTKKGADPKISVDVNANGRVENNLDYDLIVTGARPDLSSSMESVHGEDSYARKVYHRHATIYNVYPITDGGFTFTSFDPDIEEFKWVLPKSALSLDGSSAKVTFDLGRGKQQLEKTIYFGAPVAAETIEQFRQKYMREPASQMQGP